MNLGGGLSKRKWTSDTSTDSGGKGNEGNSLSRRIGGTVKAADACDQQTSVARLQKADDLLSAGDISAGGDQGYPDRDRRRTRRGFLSFAGFGQKLGGAL